MAKRTKKDKRRVLLGLLVISIMLSYLSVFVYNYWNQILTNEKEKIRLTEEYEALLKTEDELNSEITNNPSKTRLLSFFVLLAIIYPFYYMVLYHSYDLNVFFFVKFYIFFDYFT